MTLRKWWGIIFHRCWIHYESPKDYAVRAMEKAGKAHKRVCAICALLASFDDLGHKTWGDKYDEEIERAKNLL